MTPPTPGRYPEKHSRPRTARSGPGPVFILFPLDPSPRPARGVSRQGREGEQQAVEQGSMVVGDQDHRDIEEPPRQGV